MGNIFLQCTCCITMLHCMRKNINEWVAKNVEKHCCAYYHPYACCKLRQLCETCCNICNTGSNMHNWQHFSTCNATISCATCCKQMLPIMFYSLFIWLKILAKNILFWGALCELVNLFNLMKFIWFCCCCCCYLFEANRLGVIITQPYWSTIEQCTRCLGWLWQNGRTFSCLISTIN